MNLPADLRQHCGGSNRTRTGTSDHGPPLFSILTPSLGYGRFIADALDSVEFQHDAGGVEHVVADGGSTDGTVEVLRAHPAVVWSSAPDGGQSDALNRALSIARGSIIGWLNADEFYLPDALSSVKHVFSHTDADVVYGDAVHVDAEGKLLRLVAHHRFDRFVLRHYGCYVPSCAFFVRRAALGNRPWDEDCRYIMDWALYLALAANRARFRYLPAALGAFRVHDERVTARPLPRQAPERRHVMSTFGIPTQRTLVATTRRVALARRVWLKARSGGFDREREAARCAGAPTPWWPAKPC